MKKVVIGIVSIIIIALIIVALVMFFNKGEENTETISGETVAVKMETTEDMTNLVNEIYTKLGDQLPNIATQEVDITDEAAVNFATGLQSTNNVEAVILSEPLMSSQAYSLVLVKTSEGADINAMKQEMLDHIDTRKWICVSAEKVYVTNHEDVICLVMSSEEWAKPVYDEFKNLVGGNVGTELQRTEEI